MAKITIGGEEYTIPEFNFVALETSWPFITQAMVLSSEDPLASPLAALRIIAAGIQEDENFQPDRFKVTATPDCPDKVHSQIVDFLRKKLKAREMVNLRACVDQILEESGLSEGEPKSGELEAVEEKANPSPETAPDLSPSL